MYVIFQFSRFIVVFRSFESSRTLCFKKLSIREIFADRRRKDWLLIFLLNYISGFFFNQNFYTKKKNCGETIRNTEIKSDESYFYVI